MLRKTEWTGWRWVTLYWWHLLGYRMGPFQRRRAREPNTIQAVHYYDGKHDTPSHVLRQEIRFPAGTEFTAAPDRVRRHVPYLEATVQLEGDGVAYLTIPVDEAVRAGLVEAE